MGRDDAHGTWSWTLEPGHGAGKQARRIRPISASRETRSGLRPSRAPAGADQVDGTLRLTPAESAILAALLAQPGRVLSRRQLLAAAGRQAAGDRAADVYIAQLRAKLGAAGEVAAIRTVRGAGYVADP